MKSLKFIPAFFIIFFFCFLLITLNGKAQLSKNASHRLNTNTKAPVKPQLSYVIIKAGHNTFGYDILENKRLLIHQPSIPGLPGNKGFTKKTDAIKVAMLVIRKINNNKMPPSVSQEELTSLKIIF